MWALACFPFFFFQAEDGIRDFCLSRGLGDVYKRQEVNDELGHLERAVEEFLDVLSPGGRLCIITFHSLEDRIVKDIFNRRADPCTCPKDFPICVCGKKADMKKITGKPIKPCVEETERNPRSRSAKLRIAEKI